MRRPTSLGLRGVASGLLLAIGTLTPAVAGGATTATPHVPVAIAQISDPQPQCEIDQSCTDQFGTVMALDAAGDLAVVGASQWDPGGWDHEPGGVGTAWIFELVAGEWTQVAQLLGPTAEFGTPGSFGQAVTISGDGSTILVSDYSYDYSTYHCDPDDTFVFTEPTTGWSGTLAPVSDLLPPSAPPDTECGPEPTSLGLSDDGSVAVSNILGDSAYLEPSGGWAAATTISPSINLAPPASFPDGQVAESWSFAEPVAVSGDGSTIAAGIKVDGPGLSGGAVDMYYEPAGSWAAAASSVTPDAVLEDPFVTNDEINLVRSGAGYVAQGHLTGFGQSPLALDETGSTLVAGNTLECATTPTTPFCDNAEYSSQADGYGWSPNASFQAGGADVLTRTPSGWVGAASLQSSDAYGADLAGSAVGVSADGTEAIVGAPARSVPGTIGYGSGAAFVFQQQGASWTEVNDVVPAELNENGDLGTTVALPGNGSTAFISDPYFGSRKGTANDHARPLVSSPNVAPLRGTVFGVRHTQPTAIRSLSPGVAVPGGSISIVGVQLTGASFSFDGHAIAPAALTATRATFHLALTAYSGPLICSAKGSAIGLGTMVHVHPPIVTKLSTHTVKPGQKLTITGKFLGPVIQVDAVNYGETSLKIVARSRTSITVLIPTHDRSGPLGLDTHAGAVRTPSVTFVK